MMRRYYQIYLANSAHDNDLTDKPGWKQLCCYVKNTKKMNRLLKSVKANQRRNTVKIKFGVKIPSDHKEAMIFYSYNGNTRWKYDDLLELNQIYNFGPFESLCIVRNVRMPPGQN